LHVPKQFSTPTPVKNLDGEKLTKEQIEKMLNDYYRERGWDDKGVPTEEKLRELDIDS